MFRTTARLQFLWSLGMKWWKLRKGSSEEDLWVCSDVSELLTEWPFCGFRCFYCLYNELFCLRAQGMLFTSYFFLLYRSLLTGWIAGRTVSLHKSQSLTNTSKCLFCSFKCELHIPPLFSLSLSPSGQPARSLQSICGQLRAGCGDGGEVLPG